MSMPISRVGVATSTLGAWGRRWRPLNPSSYASRGLVVEQARVLPRDRPAACRSTRTSVGRSCPSRRGRVERSRRSGRRGSGAPSSWSTTTWTIRGCGLGRCRRPAGVGAAQSLVVVHGHDDDRRLRDLEDRAAGLGRRERGQDRRLGQSARAELASDSAPCWAADAERRAVQMGVPALRPT